MNPKEKKLMNEILLDHEKERKINNKVIVGYMKIIRTLKELNNLISRNNDKWVALLPPIWFALGYLYGHNNLFLLGLAIMCFVIILNIINLWRK